MSILSVVAVTYLASAQEKPASPLKLISLDVFPQQIQLVGRDSRQQLLVTGKTADGQELDLTRQASFTLDREVAEVSSTGVLTPLSSGEAKITVEHAGLQAYCLLSCENGETFTPLDFTNDIVPILTRFGCNGGGCHGKNNGRGGFAISLFGFDPMMDFDAIVKDGRGRRIFPSAPEQSLLLKKPVASVPHGGGKRLDSEDPAYHTLLRWIEEGCQWGNREPKVLQAVEIFPDLRLMGHQQNQQVAVTAVYSDGSRRDVTALTTFRTNEPSIATVDEHGMVTSQGKTGETGIVAIYQSRVAVMRLMIPVPQEQSLAESEWPEYPIQNFIDEHILAKLKQLRVPPSEIVDDATFFRRAWLQLTGKLPSPEELEQFQSDSDPQKRAKLVDRLTASGDFADHFAQKWSDILRNRRRGQAPRLPGTIGFHRWIRDALAVNMPYDQFVREIICAVGDPAFHPPAQWYHEVRSLDQCVDDTAQVFLGVRIGCARCHNHPFENYTQEDYYGLAAYFARVSRKGGNGVAERRADEVIYLKPEATVKHPVTNQVVLPHGLQAKPTKIAAYDDPRHDLVDWMAQPDNPYFAKAFVNRMWAHFFGRGIVEPMDDLRETNPPMNAPLLDALANEFVRSGFDMRHIIRTICKSSCYQLSSKANDWNLAESQNHSRFYPQRLSAEVLLDAIDTVTASPTSYSGLPPGTRAVQLPDEGYSNSFLRLFGRPLRESACECERAAEPSLSQSLFLLNDRFIQSKVESSKGTAGTLAADKRPNAEKVIDLFRKVLLRQPTDAEFEQAVAYLEAESDARQGYSNLLWALINTKEFLYVH